MRSDHATKFSRNRSGRSGRYDKGDKKGAEEDMQKVLELDPQALNGISGDYEAEGIEQKVKQAYTFLNPFGI